MTPDGMRTSRVVALALGVGTLVTAQGILSDFAAGNKVTVAPRVVIGLLFWGVWAFLTPVVLAALRRWPLDAKPLSRPLIVHAVIAPLLSTVQTFLTLGLLAVTRYFSGTVGVHGALVVIPLRSALVWGVFNGVFFYWLIAVVYAALRFRSLYVAERLSAAALETELTRSTLDALRSQLRPHFLFNTLNAISGLVPEDTEAQRMLLRLSSLLRRSLDEQAHEVLLSQELEFLNEYLDIQRVRFGDRLVVQLDVEAAVLNARVPVFLLQPLLENAIEHGGSDDGRTTILLSASREHDTLRVVLEDHGSGVASGTAVREGIGLRNTRERLLHLHGPRATVELRAVDGMSGARVEIRMPFSAAAE